MVYVCVGVSVCMCAWRGVNVCVCMCDYVLYVLFDLSTFFGGGVGCGVGTKSFTVPGAYQFS